MKEFCPHTCGNFEEKDDRICRPGGKHGTNCWHIDDKAYKGPVPIELMWYANVWINALIVGKNGDDFIIKSPKSEGVTYIKKTSRLIRKIERD